MLNNCDRDHSFAIVFTNDISVNRRGCQYNHNWSLVVKVNGSDLTTQTRHILTLPRESLADRWNEYIVHVILVPIGFRSASEHITTLKSDRPRVFFSVWYVVHTLYAHIAILRGGRIEDIFSVTRFSHPANSGYSGTETRETGAVEQ